MTDEQDWQKSLSALRGRAAARKTAAKARKDPAAFIESFDAHHGREALMTLVQIMKDDSDPRLQIAAAKVLLEKSEKRPLPLLNETDTGIPTADDIDAALAVAKAVLDELAQRKTGGVAEPGAMAAEGAPRPDHPAG